MPSIMTMVEFLTTEMPLPQRAVVQKFVDEAEFFRVIPWETDAKAYFPYNQQTALPSTTTRAVGETYSHSQGTVTPGAEPLKIFGGLSKFDSFQVETGSGSRRSSEMQAFVESVILNFQRDFIVGDSQTDPRDMRGLVNRLAVGGSQVVENSAGTGAALSIAKALEGQLAVKGMTHWLMSPEQRNNIVLTAHDTAVGGYILRDKDGIGGTVTSFCEKPIITIDRDATDAKVIPFTEAAAGGGTSSCSIYAVAFGPQRCHGIQANFPNMRDLGQDPTNGTQYNAVLDWYASFVLQHERSASRVRGITTGKLTL